MTDTRIASTSPPSNQGSVRWLITIAMQLIRRPRLATTALRQALVLAPRNWWRSWPPLPLPAADYLHFRSVTAYGGEGDHLPEADDVIAWLSWVQAWPAVTAGSAAHAGENAAMLRETAN